MDNDRNWIKSFIGLKAKCFNVPSNICLRKTIKTSVFNTDVGNDFGYVGGAGFVTGVGILRVCVTTRRGPLQFTCSR